MTINFGRNILTGTIWMNGGQGIEAKSALFFSKYAIVSTSTFFRVFLKTVRYNMHEKARRASAINKHTFNYYLQRSEMHPPQLKHSKNTFTTQKTLEFQKIKHQPLGICAVAL